MARTLVLVRHGKAEHAMDGCADIDRRLTQAGTAALEAAYPRTFSLLANTDAAAASSSANAYAITAESPGQPFVIWVSPALRARQTAKQVTSALEANRVAFTEPKEHKSLWYQDPVSFLEELAATPEDARIIAVGHIPFMEGMLERLTNADIAFTPGAAAAVSLNGNVHESGSGRLLWFVQGPRVK